ncbi:MAG: PKD domain-containing protein [Anaerolineae bacterium]|jgi:hypothetical protein
MKFRKWHLILPIVVIVMLSWASPIADVWSSPPVPPAETSPPEDLALNPDRTGFPHPLESSRGWGGGWDKWDIVDGTRREAAWYNGLAFTGGRRPYIEPCGWRQATISFAEPQTFNRVMVWHHGSGHIPNTYKIQYWDEASSDWEDVFSTTNGHNYLAYPTDEPSNWWEGFSTPTENTFEPVTSNKVRFKLWNCDITHGWIYEFEVYAPARNQPPVANAGGPYTGDEGDTITLTAASSLDPDNDIVSYEWDLDNDGEYDDASGIAADVTFNDDGAHTVGLKVTDDHGAYDTTTASVLIDNVAPDAEAGADQVVYRDEEVAVAGTWDDPAGSYDEPYDWSWDLDGDASADRSGSADYGDTVEAMTSFALEGTYELTFWVTDKDGGSDSDGLTVEVLNQPPVCSGAAPSVEQIWPPNHKFQTVEILDVIDPEGDPIAIAIDNIYQDEPVDGEGDGSHVPDGRGVGTSVAEVRAERQGGGDGRVYHIYFSADDGHGGTCTGEVLVGVAHNKKDAAVDNGALFDSTANP